MPETFAQWLWFVFFAGGALGGWASLILITPVALDEGRKALKRRRR